MSCPHYKKISKPVRGAGKPIGTCAAHRDRIMVPTLDELRSFCHTERYDECPFYLQYIERCTKEDFSNILVDLSDVDLP